MIRFSALLPISAPFRISAPFECVFINKRPYSNKRSHSNKRPYSNIILQGRQSTYQRRFIPVKRKQNYEPTLKLETTTTTFDKLSVTWSWLTFRNIKNSVEFQPQTIQSLSRVCTMPECHMCQYTCSLCLAKRSAKPVQKKSAKTGAQSVVQEPDRNEDELKANSETIST